MSAPTRLRRPSRVVLAALLAVVLGAVLGGCGLRVEAEPPAIPSPDAAEELRQRTALETEEIRRSAAALEAALADPARSVTRVLEVAEAHLDAVGGVWQPFAGPTPGTSPTPGATPSPSPAPVADDPEGLVALLDEAAASARTDAAAASDVPTARLLAALAVSRTLLADAVAAELVPELERPPSVAGDEVPSGPNAEAVEALVRGEDALGAAYETVAARSTGETRQRAAARAAVHRARAEAWATAAGFSRTPQDPRRAAYDLPASLTGTTDPGARDLALAELEAELALAYLDVATELDPGAAATGRPALLDLSVDTWRVAVRLGVTPPALPGLA